MVSLCCGVSEAPTHAEAAGAQKIFDGVQQVKCAS
jgi:hypothetical protein